jgi:hypothetical protein
MRIDEVGRDFIWGAVILPGDWGGERMYSTEPYDNSGHYAEFFDELPDQFYVDQAKEALLKGADA